MKTIILATLVALLTMACGEPAVNTDTQRTRKADITCYSGGQKVVDVTNTTNVKYSNGLISFTSNNVTTSTTADCVVVDKN